MQKYFDHDWRAARRLRLFAAIGVLLALTAGVLLARPALAAAPGTHNRVSASRSLDYAWQGGGAAASTLSFSSATASVNEGAGNATITLKRSGSSAGEVRANVAVSGGSAPIADYGAGGSIDPSFDPGSGAEATVTGLALQSDGKIVVVGNFTTMDGRARAHIARLNANGSLDTSFGPSANGNVSAAALQSDGKIVVVGSFTAINGTARAHIARLNANGSLDTSFDPSADSTVYALAIQNDGKIVIGGSFTVVNSTVRNSVARLNDDGSLDSGFEPGDGANNTVRAIAVQASGKIVIGGSFSSINNTGRNFIARLNANGTLDSSFDPGNGPGNIVWAVAAQPDGKILIGGQFTTFNGTNRGAIARLNANGTLDASFNPGTGASDTVLAIVVQPDASIAIGGVFTVVNSFMRNGVARLSADGSLDTSFDPGAGANNSVYALALQPDKKLLIGGSFTTVDGAPRNRIARLGLMSAIWADGDSADKTISLPIVDDAIYEGDETVVLSLSPGPGAVAGTPSSLTLTINDNDPPTLTITSEPPPNGTYGAAYSHTFTSSGAPAPTWKISGALPPGLSFNPTSATISGRPTQAGSFGNITVTASNGADPDATQSFAIVIAKAQLTARAENKVRFAGQPNPPLTILYTGLVNGDTAADLDSKPIASTSATTNSPVGVYEITVSGGGDANYSLSYAKGTLRVLPLRAKVYIPLASK